MFRIPRSGIGAASAATNGRGIVQGGSIYFKGNVEEANGNGGEHYGLGRARVVISYDTPDLEGEPVILASNRTHWEERREV